MHTCPSHLMGGILVVQLQLPFAALFLCLPCSANALTLAWVLWSSNHTKIWCYMMLWDSIVAKACRVLRKDNGMGWGTRKFHTFYPRGVGQSEIHHQKNKHLWCFGWKTQTKIRSRFCPSLKVVFHNNKPSCPWFWSGGNYCITLLCLQHTYCILGMPCVCRSNWEKHN